MSYQALARKWRPKTFSELVGQEHVVTETLRLAFRRIGDRAAAGLKRVLAGRGAAA